MNTHHLVNGPPNTYQLTNNVTKGPLKNTDTTSIKLNNINKKKTSKPLTTTTTMDHNATVFTNMSKNIVKLRNSLLSKDSALEADRPPKIVLIKKLESLLILKTNEKKIQDHQMRDFLVESFSIAEISGPLAVASFALIERFLCYTLLRGDIDF